LSGKVIAVVSLDEFTCPTKIHEPDWSSLNMPGRPTRSILIPSSASASILRGCSRANRDEKPIDVYCPDDRLEFCISRSLGAKGGGGSALEYRIRAM
jgi:hypothetical protein